MRNVLCGRHFSRFRGSKTIKELVLSFLHLACILLFFAAREPLRAYVLCGRHLSKFSSSRACKSLSPMRTAPWRGHLRPKSPLRRVPLAVWHKMCHLPRQLGFDCDPLSSTASENVQLRFARRISYSVLYVLIYKGNRLVAVVDRKNKMHIIRPTAVCFDA